MLALPQWPGPNNDGLLFATGPQQSFSTNLLEGDRGILLISSAGNYLSVAVIRIDALSTIIINPGPVVLSTKGLPGTGGVVTGN